MDGSRHGVSLPGHQDSDLLKTTTPGSRLFSVLTCDIETLVTSIVMEWCGLEACGRPTGYDDSSRPLRGAITTASTGVQSPLAREIASTHTPRYEEKNQWCFRM
jgi:hypothetical protein